MLRPWFMASLALAAAGCALDGEDDLPPTDAIATTTALPVADAFVDQGYPATNYGKATVLHCDGSPRRESFLRFDLAGLAGPVQSARLEVYVTATSADGPELYATGTGWSETALTWNTRPARTSGLIADQQAIAGGFVAYDVSSIVTSAGSYGFVLASKSSDGADFSSREGAHPPRLVVTVDGGTTQPPDPDAMTLPIEVIGPDGYTERVRFDVADPSGITSLYLQGHRLGYAQNGPKGGQAKASVRLNGGAWIDLTNATAQVYQPEKTYGGIGGGFYTVRLTVPVSGVVAGPNTLELRFNGTDGATSGYRILAWNLLKGTTPVLPASAFAVDDPATWTAPDPSAVATGKALFEQQGILTLPGGAALRTSCADCHARDGRDLKYFNYSNWSIVQRSRFHGLSDAQGAAIASYIRSLPTPAPAAARPWNPPYQPGPGLDARPASEWAAGAGLAAVLAADKDMLPYLHPAGVSWASIASTSSTLDVRELPIPVQLPDWNAWLPALHPLDVWGSTFTSGEAYAAYTKLRADLPSLVSNPTGTLAVRLGNFDDGVRAFIGKGRTDSGGGGPWRTQSGTTVNAVPSRYAVEDAKLGLSQWMGVKTWELAQEFGLETLGPRVLPAVGGIVHGEIRGWPSDGQSVWANAPHMTADNKRNFAGQSELVGVYQSSVWYQLQMILDPGQRQRIDTTPVDWQYHFTHMKDLATLSKAPQALRFMSSMIKAWQARDNGLGPATFGWQLRYLHPWEVFAEASGSTAFFDALDGYQAGLRNAILAAMLGAFLDLVDTRTEFALSTWPRRNHTDYSDSTHTYWYALEETSYKPTAYSGSGQVFPQPKYNQADSFYRLIPRLRDRGIDAAVLGRLKTWCKQAWPQGAWDGL